jgi:hypothetical protein
LENDALLSEMTGYDSKDVWNKAFDHELDAWAAFGRRSSLSMLDSLLPASTFDGYSPRRCDDVVSNSLPTFHTTVPSSNAPCEEELLQYGSEDLKPLRESLWKDMLPFWDLTEDELYLNLNCEYRSAFDHNGFL